LRNSFFDKVNIFGNINSESSAPCPTRAAHAPRRAAPRRAAPRRAALHTLRAALHTLRAALRCAALRRTRSAPRCAAPRTTRVRCVEAFKVRNSASYVGDPSSTADILISNSITQRNPGHIYLVLFISIFNYVSNNTPIFLRFKIFFLEIA
jgi:hypothetical protein